MTWPSSAGGRVATSRLSGHGSWASVLSLSRKRKWAESVSTEAASPPNRSWPTSEGFQWARRAAKEGILDQRPRIDFSGMMERKSRVVGKMVANLEELLAAKGVHTDVQHS